jgi:hypothetical protein
MTEVQDIFGMKDFGKEGPVSFYPPGMKDAG